MSSQDSFFGNGRALIAHVNPLTSKQVVTLQLTPSLPFPLIQDRTSSLLKQHWALVLIFLLWMLKDQECNFVIHFPSKSITKTNKHTPQKTNTNSWHLDRKCSTEGKMEWKN